MAAQFYAASINCDIGIRTKSKSPCSYMRTDLIRDLFQYLDSDGSLQVGDGPDDVNRQIEQMALPIELKRVPQWCWTNSGGEAGPYVLFSVEESLACDDLTSLLVKTCCQLGMPPMVIL